MNDALTDVNVYLGRWPFRRLPHDEPAPLVEKLRQKRVTQAWTGSFDGVFHKDVTAVNARLAEVCRRYGDGLLIPFGSINPLLPDWKGDLRRCVEDHRMPGVRLHPSYHGYRLDAPEFRELLEAAAEHRLVVQIAVRMEDARTQHPLARVEAVDPTPLRGSLADLPALRVMLLNSQRDLRPDVIDTLAATGQVSFDIAMLEGVGGIEQLLKTVALEQIAFGSYLPFFYFEAAHLKLRESPLAAFQDRALRRENAARILKPA
jgi:uncharacterized protein